MGTSGSFTDPSIFVDLGVGLFFGFGLQDFRGGGVDFTASGVSALNASSGGLFVFGISGDFDPQYASLDDAVISNFLTLETVPEPATAFLLAGGLAGLAAARRLRGP